MCSQLWGRRKCGAGASFHIEEGRKGLSIYKHQKLEWRQRAKGDQEAEWGGNEREEKPEVTWKRALIQGKVLVGMF